MSRLPPSHLALAPLVVAIRGTSFVAIRVGLDRLPPRLFAGLRFAFASLPAPRAPRPRIGWGSVAACGLPIGAGQFELLFVAMRERIPLGLATLVVQAQVLFTIGPAAWWLGERVRPVEVAALAVAALGLLLIALRTSGDATPPGPRPRAPGARLRPWRLGLLARRGAAAVETGGAFVIGGLSAGILPPARRPPPG